MRDDLVDHGGGDPPDDATPLYLRFADAPAERPAAVITRSPVVRY